MSRVMTAAFVALAALAFAACASTGGVAGDQGIAVEVVNDLVPASTLTIWMVPEYGPRKMLGAVSPNETKVFRFDAIPTEPYHLFARATGGAMASRKFTVDGETTGVTWNLNINTIEID